MQARCEWQRHSAPFTTICQAPTFPPARRPRGDPTVEGQMQENTHSQFCLRLCLLYDSPPLADGVEVPERG